MSRPIKFRAWNSRKCQWVAGLVIGLDGHVVNWSSGGVEIELQQFTGLKDRNGIEVYEGDILKDTQHGLISGDTVSIDAVRFSTDPAGFTFGDRWSPLNSVDIERMEVIGNIYENPELLEQAS